MPTATPLPSPFVTGLDWLGGPFFYPQLSLGIAGPSPLTPAGLVSCKAGLAPVP